MHVLVTADTLGGVWTYARELVTGLAKRGVQVTLVSFGEIPSPAQMSWLDGLRNLDFRPTAFRLEWMQESEQDLEASAEHLRSIVRETQPDVLHLNQYFYGALDVDVPRLVVAHSDVVSWWAAVHGAEPPETNWSRWYREIVTRGLSRATAVVAPTRWMLEAAERYYVKPKQASVVYNGRTPALFSPHISKENYVISVGRLWDSGKQVTLLAQQQDAPQAAYIVGSEQHPDSGLRSNTIFGRTGRSRVHFKGPQSEAQLRQLYARASTYVVTSRYEPFGLAPLEAAFSRCAIVCNDIPSLREVWGDSALYFAANSGAGLARALERLGADRELRLTYGSLAYQRAMQRYTADRMVDDYLALYQTMVGSGALAA
jgi:glycosyltransferase involved in cell wall biosynthesis